MSQPAIALVGCGHWGRNIARTLARLGVLAVVSDVDHARAEALGAEFGAPVMPTEMAIQHPGIDAVAIATPASNHHATAMSALRAGKDVFVEKPMALHPGDAEEMIALAEAEDRILMVGHLLRYHPAFERLAELVASGELGRINYLYSTRLNFGRIRREEDVLWSFAPHDLSMILALTGERPASVRTEGRFVLHNRIADVTTTHLEFPSGLSGHVFVSWLHPSKEQRLVVMGERAMAVFDDLQPAGRKLALRNAHVEWRNGTPIAAPAEPEYVPIPAIEPLMNEMQHFIDCVTSHKRPLTDGSEGLEVLRVLDEAGGQLLELNKPSATVSPISISGPDIPAVPTTPDGVHPTAVVDDDVTIGADTRIWHFSHIMPNTTIGSGCSLGQNVVAGPNVTIGNGVKIQNNVSVYEGVTLEDDVFCGPSMVFTNVTTPRASVSRKDEFAPTLVRTGASIGANATIICGSTVGRHAMVAAGAVVTKDVADYALVAGVPARRIGWVSTAGEVLGDDLCCPRTGEQFQLVDDRLEPVPSDDAAVEGDGNDDGSHEAEVTPLFESTNGDHPDGQSAGNGNGNGAANSNGTSGADGEVPVAPTAPMRRAAES